MHDAPGVHWHPVVAYLYVLHLDGPSLAWEYLRRNPEYRHDWQRRRPQQAQRWGLRLLEDPRRDARDACPDWFPDPPGVVQIQPDPDPAVEALPFRFWQLPGNKHVVHDGHRLLLTLQLLDRDLRLAVSPALDDGMAHSFAVHADARFGQRWRTVAAELALLDAAAPDRVGIARDRPGRTALLHLRTLQALDGVEAGASQRRVAEVLFGSAAVAARWHSDGQLRAYVRRLIARGRRLMQGDYRRLLHPGVEGGGRFHPGSKRP